MNHAGRTFKALLPRTVKYFRDGFGLYVSYIISFIGFTSSVYYLAINNISFLRRAFPDFWTFVLVCLIIIPPTSVTFGWMHYKRGLKPLYDAEQDISVEANPYNYKGVPGKELELNLPFFVKSVDLTIRLYDRLAPGLLTEEDRGVLKGLKLKAQGLINGGRL